MAFRHESANWRGQYEQNRAHAGDDSGGTFTTARCSRSFFTGTKRGSGGDAAYTGHTEAMRAKAPCAQDFTSKRGYRNRSLSEAEMAANKHKSSTRSRVEHVFGILKGDVRLSQSPVSRSRPSVST